MDSSILLIVVGATIVFIGLLAYKALWFVRKINEEPEASETKQAQPAENTNPATAFAAEPRSDQQQQ